MCIASCARWWQRSYTRCRDKRQTRKNVSCGEIFLTVPSALQLTAEKCHRQQSSRARAAGRQAAGHTQTPKSTRHPRPQSSALSPRPQNVISSSLRCWRVKNRWDAVHGGGCTHNQFFKIHARCCCKFASLSCRRPKPQDVCALLPACFPPRSRGVILR